MKTTCEEVKRWRKKTTSIEDCVNATIKDSRNIPKKAKDKLITTANNSHINRINVRINRKIAEENLENKYKKTQLYEYFKRQTK